MKRTALLFLILLGSSGYGQTITERVADSICTKFSGIIENTKAENLNDSLNSCLGSFMANNSVALFEEHQLEGYTVENIHFLQAKLLATLDENCEAFRNLKGTKD